MPKTPGSRLQARQSMCARRAALARWTAAWVLIGAFAHAQHATATRHGVVVRIKVHGTSLEGNLAGDSPDRDASVYLPPSYATASQRRYPVVYLLHGFTDTDLRWFGSEPLFDGDAAADRAFANGTPEMIVVMPNARTRYFGSMYSSSATTGDWESFVAHDLVAQIDASYRSIPDRMSRGLAGHSMGGYGAVRIGMKYPDVFSSIYAMSACCLVPASNMQDPSRSRIPDIQTDAELEKADFFTKAMYASAAAWSPNPTNPPRYMDLPWADGQFRPLVAQKWAANAPLVVLDQYVRNLERLHAIAFDVGTQDRLLPGSLALDQALTAYGLAHTYETYEGDHLNRIEARFEKNVLPFFARSLRQSTDVGGGS